MLTLAKLGGKWLFFKIKKCLIYENPVFFLQNMATSACTSEQKYFTPQISGAENRKLCNTI